jgi:hypothetical protein
MAVNRAADTATELALTFNNGDLEALRTTATRLGFANEESMIRFMLAALSKSATRSIIITDSNGARVALNPSADLLRPANNS